MLESSIPLRPVVRQIMKAAPERRYSMTGLLALARRQIPDVSENEVADALNWNLGKGFVDTGVHNELRVEVWFLTDDGKAYREE